MTTKHLIDELTKLDPEAEVRIELTASVGQAHGQDEDEVTFASEPSLSGNAPLQLGAIRAAGGTVTIRLDQRIVYDFYQLRLILSSQLTA